MAGRTKPIVVFPRPWLGPKEQLNLRRGQIRGKKVILQERAFVSLERVADRLQNRRRPIRLNVRQSFRTHAYQKVLWHLSLHGRLWACAPPGCSYHEQAIAVDLSVLPSDIVAVREEMDKDGWKQFSTSTDPFHWSKGVVG